MDTQKDAKRKRETDVQRDRLLDSRQNKVYEANNYYSQHCKLTQNSVV
jgi:hypothetical protein